MKDRNILFIGTIVGLLVLSGCGSSEYVYPEAEVSAENLETTVRFLSEMQPSRSCHHPKSLRKSAKYILEQFEAYGMEPIEQSFKANGTEYSNIIVRVGPKEGPRVIVGAHYDVYFNWPGADDNASGVAGLLEIARFTKIHEDLLPYGVDFVAYTLEEPPFFRTDKMGSYIHAQSLHDDEVEVRGMICLEMIGYFSDEPGSQKFPSILLKLLYPNKGNFIGVVSDYGSGGLNNQAVRHMKKADIDVRSLKAPGALAGVDLSDHRNYWKFGYDAVMITDTAFFRNMNYHQPTDTADTLSYDRMQEVVRGVCWVLLNMDK